MRRSAWALGLAALAGCEPAPPIPQADLLLRVAVGVEAVESGKAFDLTVVRVWSRGWEPGPFPDRALAPLVLRAAGTERRDDGVRTEERLRYRAYAFARDEVLVPAPSFRARRRGGGEERVVAAAPLRLRVAPALPPGAPEAPELPGDPIPEPAPRAAPWLVAAAVVTLAAAAWAVARRRRTAPRAAPATAPAGPPPPDPSAVALAGLAAVAARSGGDEAQRRADVVEAAAILRAYADERTLGPGTESTSEELVRWVDEDRGPERAALLARVLRAADWVKFAATTPAPAERTAAIEDAVAFVRATEPPARLEEAAS